MRDLLTLNRVLQEPADDQPSSSFLSREIGRAAVCDVSGRSLVRSVRRSFLISNVLTLTDSKITTGAIVNISFIEWSSLRIERVVRCCVAAEVMESGQYCMGPGAVARAACVIELDAITLHSA